MTITLRMYVSSMFMLICRRYGKLFLFIIFISAIILIIFCEYNKVSSDNYQEIIDIVSKDFRYAELYRKKDRLPKNLKYILLWTTTSPFYNFEEGQKRFIDKNCSKVNCYVTTDRNFFDDLTKFDVIAFHGPDLTDYKHYDLPQQRHPRQKYIFYNMESADNYPICDPMFDNFFNWTATYKLDSNYTTTYLIVKNDIDEVVGPSKDIKWLRNMVNLDDIDSFVEKFYRKRNAAAWFVSNCKSKSRRSEFVVKLKNELRKYGREIHVYGTCGTHECSRNNRQCDTMIGNDYYFYLALENSFAEDYVTEKVLKPLNNNAIPIVYGGANYTRFLPPSSYIDALNYTIKDLALHMHNLILNVDEYRKYFKWKPYYTITESPDYAKVCDLCNDLNEDAFHVSWTYTDFRLWWNPDYKKRCQAG